MYQTTICIVGTDKRQDYLADYLEAQGFQVVRQAEFSPSALRGAGLLVGPVSFYQDGKLRPEIEEACRKAKVPVLNYMSSEDFLLRNAELTAEGFLATLITNTPFSLKDARILLLGLGRCGRALLSCLRQLKVRTDAFDTVPKPLLHAKEYNAVINTIPAPVITETCLRALSPSCILFDIASPPGGYDAGAAGKLGMKLIRCPGIPGKTSPKSAGYAIGEAAISYLN